MTDCTKYRNLIEKHLDGIIAGSELAELRAHTDTCPPAGMNSTAVSSCRAPSNKPFPLRRLLSKPGRPSWRSLLSNPRVCGLPASA